MPNGKGSLECCCCVHYQGEWTGYDAFGELGWCNYHKAELPASLSNRICSNFSADENYYRYNSVFEFDGVKKRITPEERFSWFSIDLTFGILYTFNYHDPKSIREILKFNKEKESK